MFVNIIRKFNVLQRKKANDTICLKNIQNLRKRRDCTLFCISVTKLVTAQRRRYQMERIYSSEPGYLGVFLSFLEADLNPRVGFCHK